jgi:hypothetical protein
MAQCLIMQVAAEVFEKYTAQSTRRQNPEEHQLAHRREQLRSHIHSVCTRQ